ncbi:MAG TPA: phenylalanine--tRNA ligase subunit beta, partial [Clostridiales bacterium]|nr:phenylalanine--tRNA ligase subunit beta [Clostridiales bacterium]
PDADKLLVTQVDIGDETIQIVTGANNIKEGDTVPVALHGSELPGGVKIKKGKLRGMESNGMMCSLDELDLDHHEFPYADPEGILILQESVKPGSDIKDVLGLDEDVIEFEITPNRQDCYSVIGLSREAAATMKKPFRYAKPVVKEEGPAIDGQVTIQIKDTDLCCRYSARIVENVKIEPSPAWMRKRLTECGIRPINNIVDITNYVMLEYGQPMHAFDFDTVKDSTIVVRRAKSGETIETLDDEKRALDEDMLLIADPEKALAVAGVMGGAYTQITDKTTRILFESANFNRKSVRLTAKRLGMRTESSGLFEKGLDPKNTINALDRAAELVEMLGAGVVRKGRADADYSPASNKTVPFEPEKINRLLGTDIQDEIMVKILDRLELQTDVEKMVIHVPSFRQDVVETADIAEEIARFYGYNHITSTLLEGKSVTRGSKTYSQKIRDTISNIMAACGLNEIYTYSFTSENVFDKMEMDQNDPRRDAVIITNPLGEDFKVMRTVMTPDMLSVISRNYNRSILEGALYEMACVYEKADNEEASNQKGQLIMGLYGQAYDFYHLKGIVETLTEELGIQNVEFIRETGLNEFHPGCTAKVKKGDVTLGVIGVIHPTVCENFLVPEGTLCGIMDTEQLVKLSSMDRKYVPLPRFPAITRDLAMVIQEDVPVGDIEKLIKANGGKYLEEVRLFDIFRGKQVGEGLKSVAYSVVFRADDRTLQDSDIQKAMERILETLQSELNAQLRK